MIQSPTTSRTWSGVMTQGRTAYKRTSTEPVNPIFDQKIDSGERIFFFLVNRFKTIFIRLSCNEEELINVKKVNKQFSRHIKLTVDI